MKETSDTPPDFKRGDLLLYIGNETVGLKGKIFKVVDEPSYNQYRKMWRTPVFILNADERTTYSLFTCNVVKITSTEEAALLSL